MKDINEDYIIVFNGEIYNFKEIKKHLFKMGKTFRTKSDTEVLLEAYKFWGKKCLDKLEGMFSFAIYDRKKSKTRGKIQELILTPNNYCLVTVPPLIWNGFKGEAERSSIVANCATLPHRDDEIIRKPALDKSIPYNWEK